MDNLIIKVNQELNKLYNYILENEDAFHSMNLKLYSAFYNVSDLLDKYPAVKENYYDIDNLYYDFCDDSYHQFIEDCNENGIPFEPSYIGRTSSFYLSNIYQWIENYRFANNPLDSVIEIFNILIDRLGYNQGVPELKGDSFELDVDANFESYIDNLKYIASGDFIKEAMQELQPIITQYNYINDFKNNQVAYLKEYMELENDLIIDTLEAEKEKDLNIWLDGVAAIFN